jgi:hypothetical protein
MIRLGPAMLFAALISSADFADYTDGYVSAKSAQSADQSADTSCAGNPAYQLLDFWVGKWDVYAGGALDGHDVVTRVLGGCAVMEEWADADGSKGFSLFYYLPSPGEWRQVWVTDHAEQAGGVKEKKLVARLDDGGVRFQGTIVGPRGPYLDRTTLTPLPSGEVHQVIEFSRDDGASWKVMYDAIYRRSPG